MPQLDLYQVDAFSATPFGGNPAAVVPLASWLPDATLQRIAAENNLSETAYVVRRGAVHDLRWFTPTVEVDLCGHATLATAWVLFEQLGAKDEVLRFATRSGELLVRRAGDGLALSSRNGYLSAAERQQAMALSRALQALARAARNAPHNLPALEAEAMQSLRAQGWEPDYLTVRQRHNLLAPDASEAASAALVVLGAARLGSTRLIDNLEF